MAVSSAAQQQEIKAFQRVKSLLNYPSTFAEPAGFETSFPDFGFSVDVGGKRLDLHIEYKADYKAQMGSMRDWIFDGRQFSTNDKTSDEKAALIDIMNSSPLCIDNGKRLLKDFQSVNPKISKIYTGMLTFEPNKMMRRMMLEKFTQITDNYQLAKINNTQLGNAIISHYKKKFKSSIKPAASASAMLMMIDSTLWLVDTDAKFNSTYSKALNNMFGKPMPKIPSLQAALEVRIQPRGLSSPDKPVSVDVMASFRLGSKIAGGVTI